MSNLKRIIIILLGLIIIVSIGAYLYINSILSTKFDINDTVYIYVDDKKSYNDILTQLDTTAHIESIENFKKVATFLKYPDNIKTGRYAISPNMNIKEVIQRMKSGQQAPIKLRFNNIRLKSDLSKRISDQLMISDNELLSLLNDSTKCKELGFTTETINSMFIPNTYEVYWDTSLDSFIKKMNSEYNKFWNEERRKKATKQGLTPTEVSILASIVEEECYFTDEYPMVAGLYLNRLKRGQLLQADPTVKYAVGDFSLKRILFKHLEVDSPYNTYKHMGLPPGPIRVPSIKGLDAVLNPTNHDYLYMCAKEDFSGRHNFAVTHAEHERNANRYRNALNSRKIF